MFKGKKMFLRVMAAYVILSLPPVFYVGYKVIRKIYRVMERNNDVSKDLNADFYIEGERSWRGKEQLLIAHAGGALFGAGGETLTYTNSLEAVEQNYMRGHRVFEIDFSLTKDGKLAAVHDWDHGREITQTGGGGGVKPKKCGM
ncbi:MAG: hypothetical protein LBJ31_01825 [Treponema sp.]|nr:hypothetical protein [Treponema sp.]